MNILITGITGFLATYMSSYFENEGHSIFGLMKSSSNTKYNSYNIEQCTLPDTQVYSIIKKIKPDVVIHAAGTASVPKSVQEPYTDFAISVPSTSMLLDAIRIHAPNAHFVFLSSAAVYGNPLRLPILETDPLQPISPYGYHKMMGELLCKEYAELYQIKCSVLRIFSAYGNGLKRQVVYEMTKKLLESSRMNKKAQFWGTGAESRDFIHAKDVAQAVNVMIKRNNREYAIFNGATGREVSMLQLAEILRKRVGETSSFAFNGHIREGDPKNWVADISNLKQLGFIPTIDFEKGTCQIVEWVRNESTN